MDDVDRKFMGGMVGGVVGCVIVTWGLALVNYLLPAGTFGSWLGLPLVLSEIVAWVGGIVLGAWKGTERAARRGT